MLTAAQKHTLTVFIKRELLKQWVLAGHALTGKMVTNANIVFNEVAGLNIDGWIDKYGEYMERGVSASKIPYRRHPTGRGGKSLYIQGLMKYVAQRMSISEGTKENKSIAFAIANAQSKKGMPLRSPRGTKWLSKFLKNIENPLELKFIEFFGKGIDVEITKMIKEYGDN